MASRGWRATAGHYGRALLGLGRGIRTVLARSILLAVALISGVLAVIRELADWTGPDIHVGSYRINVYFLVALLALLWVQFAAWRDQQRETERLTAQTARLEEELRDKTNRAALRDRLSYSLQLGELTSTILEDAAARATREFEDLREEASSMNQAQIEERVARILSDKSVDDAREWEQGVGKQLERGFDRAKRTLFELELSGEGPQTPPGMESHYAKAWQRIQIRLSRLRVIMQELER